MFSTTKKAEKYIDQIVHQLVILFNVSHQEAIGRVNRHWTNCEHIDDESMIYHMLPDEWAHEVYYGSDSMWWGKDKSALSPLPYEDDIK
ncbi:hypothetical protein [Paenibacillus sp. FSL W7-1287]|nr:hypothetical protein [Paenibacillus camelliae]